MLRTTITHALAITVGLVGGLYLAFAEPGKQPRGEVRCAAGERVCVGDSISSIDLHRDHPGLGGLWSVRCFNHDGPKDLDSLGPVALLTANCQQPSYLLFRGTQGVTQIRTAQQRITGIVITSGKTWP